MAQQAAGNALALAVQYPDNAGFYKIEKMPPASPFEKED
jgi:hypothetical protein